MTSVACTHEFDGLLGYHSSLEEALMAFRRHRPAIVIDDGGPQFHAELCCPADGLTTESMAFMIKETSGLVVAAIPAAAAERLELPLMDYKPDSVAGRYCVALDAHDVATTGISATDRALTLRRLASADAQAAHFTRPGHVIPAVAGGHFAGINWTPHDAAHELSLRAGLSGVVACAALVDGVELSDRQSISNLSMRHSVPVVRSADLRERLPRPSVLGVSPSAASRAMP